MAFVFRSRRGELHPFAKIPDEGRRECRRRWENGEGITALAKEKGVKPPTMHAIVHDPYWAKPAPMPRVLDTRPPLGIDQGWKEKR